jgi:hypothetical protein
MERARLVWVQQRITALAWKAVMVYIFMYLHNSSLLVLVFPVTSDELQSGSIIMALAVLYTKIANEGPGDRRLQHSNFGTQARDLLFLRTQGLETNLPTVLFL